MSTFQGSIGVSLRALLAGAPDVGALKHAVSELFDFSFTNGTGANQANNMFVDDFTIAGAGSQTYDLAGGVANAFGVTLTFTAIKAIIILNTGTAELTYGNGANPFVGFVGAGAHTNKIAPGGLLVFVDPTAAGQTVTAGTGDVVKLAGTDAAGTIIVIGEA